MKIHIYALYDPRCPEVVRYIGASRDVKARLIGHKSLGQSWRKDLWISHLSKEGLEPSLRILETVEEELSIEREAYWIKHYRSPMLTNMNTNKSELKGNLLAKTVAKVERDLIVEYLEKHYGKIAPTAKALGISRPTLYSKMKNYDINLFTQIE